MSDPATQSSSAIGHQARFRLSRFGKNNDSKYEPHGDKSRNSKLHKAESVGQAPGTDLPPRRTVSEHRAQNVPFASLRHRFSNRHASGGFGSGLEARNEPPLSPETSAHRSKSKGKEKGKENRLTSGPNGQEDGLQLAMRQKDSKSRPKSSVAGSFLSHDVGSGESSTTGRRSINFDERHSPPSRHTSASPEPFRKHFIRDSLSNKTRRSSPSNTPNLHEIPPIDPAQIVRMALNLSEGRRMHMDPGHVPSIPSPIDPRAVSATVSAHPVQRSSNSEHRSSPRERSSKNYSSSPAGLNHFQDRDTSTPSKSSAAHSSLVVTEEQPQFTFSPATLARAERAKVFFELANEHRRLLQHLPPLRHSNLEGNEHHAPLGRAYNPIQYLRNRESRGSQRVDLSASSAGWEDLNVVQGWVDTVEREASQDGYVEGDVAHLPQWASGTGESTNPHSTAYRDRQNYGGTTGPRLEQSQSFWSISPSSLLADAYWLEQSDNKTMIRTRNGHYPFKQFRRPGRRRAGTATSTRTRTTKHTLDSEDHTGTTVSPSTANFTDSSVEMDKDDRRELDNIGLSPQHRSRTTRVKRHLFGKSKENAQREDGGSAGENEMGSIEGFPTRRGPKNTNIGPLERHMKLMIEKERQSHPSDPDLPQSRHSAKDPEGRRGGVSEQSPTQYRSNLDAKFTNVRNTFEFPYHDCKRDFSNETPRISVEDHDGRQPTGTFIAQVNGQVKPPSRKPIDHGEQVEAERVVNRASRLGFLRRHRQSESRTAEQDFAHHTRNDQRKRRKSYTYVNNSDSEEQTTSPDITSVSYASSESLAKESNWDRRSPKKSHPNTRHFFKPGRIGDVLGHDRTEAGKFDPTWNNRRYEQPSRLSRETFLSDTDGTGQGARGHRKHKSSELAVPQVSRRHRRSVSTGAEGRIGHQQYHMKNLPSFVSSGISPQKQGRHLSPYGDHVSRQQEQRRLQHKRSRHSDLAPPSINTSDVSPTASSPELSRANTEGTSMTAPPRSGAHNHGFVSGDESVSGSEQLTRSASRRLNAVLSVPGTLGKGGLPMTALSNLDAANDAVRRLNIPQGNPTASSDKPVALRSQQAAFVGKGSISYVRSMLLASSIKAQYIVQRANAPRETMQAYLVNAYRTAGRDLATAGTVSRQQEFAVAAQLLSDHLKSTMSAFDASALRFRNETCHGLNARIDDLRDLVGNHLSHQVHDEGDRADSFVAQLTTTHTLSIKQVNDSVDLMMRKRRQRLRYLRRTGFTLLEYLLVGLMWFIWAFVSVLGLLKRSVGFLVSSVRWLLWLS